MASHKISALGRKDNKPRAIEQRRIACAILNLPACGLEIVLLRTNGNYRDAFLSHTLVNRRVRFHCARFFARVAFFFRRFQRCFTRCFRLEPGRDGGDIFHRPCCRCAAFSRSWLFTRPLRHQKNCHCRLSHSGCWAFSQQPGVGAVATLYLLRARARHRVHPDRHGAAYFS